VLNLSLVLLSIAQNLLLLFAVLLQASLDDVVAFVANIESVEAQLPSDYECDVLNMYGSWPKQCGALKEVAAAVK
jgi:hypothetical protein